MTKHTKPLDPKDVQRWLRAKPDDTTDEYADLWHAVEQMPENRYSRLSGLIIIACLVGVIVIVVYMLIGG